MQIELRRESNLPLYRQIVGQVRDLIQSGALPPGHRLPPVRQLAAELGLTRLTVHSAYAELQAEGLVEPHVGRGTFVAAEPWSAMPAAGRAEPAVAWVSQSVLGELLRISDRSGILSFAQAFPDSASYPQRELTAALRTVMARPDVLEYGPIQGTAELRQETAALLLER